MKFLKVSLISLLLSLMPTIAFPNIGDLDVTFGIGGIVTHGGIGEAVAIQPDGKILLTGESNNGANLDLFVARLNSDGILDTTFSNNGVFMYDVGDDYGCAIALQKDGKIVVAGGSSLSGIYDVLVLRLNADGTVDNTFGSEGIVRFRIGNFSFAYKLAIQPDDKIVVGGRAGDGITDFLLLRYNSDGSLDASFGNEGVVTTHMGMKGSCNGMSLQKDGKIVVIGTFIAEMAPITDLLVLRYNSDGTLDGTFGNGGMARYDYGGWCDFCYEEHGYAVAIQPDGKIVAVGSILYNNGAYWLLIVRFNSNGTLDKSFGSGVWNTPSNGDIYGNDVTIQEDMRIVVTGSTYPCFYCDSDTFVVRFKANGGLDRSFNGVGYFIYDSGGYEYGRGIGLQPDQKIVVTGLNSTLRLIGSNKSLVVLSPNGDIIPSGSNYLIKWAVISGNAIKFKLKYSLDAGQTWRLITPDLVSGTSYDWKVPIPRSNTKFLIKVEGFDGIGQKVGYDKSDAPSQVEVVKLTYPDGAEIWESGETRTITWRTNETIKPVAKFQLSYTMDNGTTWLPITTITGGNPGTFDWTVPSLTKTKPYCRIKVLLKDSTGNSVGRDISDRRFTMQPAP